MDAVAVAGDLTAYPDELAKMLPPGYVLAVEEGPTTNTGSTIDNVATNDGCMQMQPQIVEFYRDVPLHHHPFSVPTWIDLRSQANCLGRRAHLSDHNCNKTESFFYVRWEVCM